MNASKLFRMSLRLLVFAGLLVAVGQLLDLVPLGQVTPSDNLLAWVATISIATGGAWLLAMVIIRPAKQATQPVARAVAQPAARPVAQPVTQPAAPAPRSSSTGPRTFNYQMPEW